MKSLIVPTNFSASSVNAAKYAAGMALMINADLYLVHVLQLPVSNAEVPLTEDIFDEMQQSGEQELQNLKLELQEQTQGKINITALLEVGSVEHQLEEFCKRKQPFAVVMGIRKNATERFLFGSNALFAIRHLQYPLLIIPEGTSFHSIQKIVLACDLTDCERTIPVEYLKELQHVFHASLDVLNVNAKKIGQLKSSTEFASLKELLRDLYPTYYFTIGNTVEEGIDKFLEENNADLLLLLPKRHGIFEFHKSHSKKMALNAALPIMTIHE
jgi:nucleotide-binding universal stress UspA family protein